MSLFFLFMFGLTGSESGWPHVSAVPPCPFSRPALPPLAVKWAIVRLCAIPYNAYIWLGCACVSVCLCAAVGETTLGWALIRRTFVLEGRQWKSPLTLRCVFVCVLADIWLLNAVSLCPSEAAKSSLWFPVQFYRHLVFLLWLCSYF